LRDPTLQAQLERAQSLRKEQVIKAEEAATANKPSLIAAANTAIQVYDDQIRLLMERRDQLTLRAPSDGVIIHDTALKRIVGNYVPSGLLICRVIRTDQLEGRISLQQQQAAMVEEGMPVRIRLWSSPGTVIHTKVSRVGTTVSDDLLHPALSSNSKGEVDVKANEKGEMKSAGRRSVVVINLTNLGPGMPMLADGMTGRGEIIVRETTVWGRVWRAILDSTTPDWHL
jgi:hypothetical protein